ncbi:hypothetical protein [Dankookia sp. P2]|uniref:hypothetical protein n=1 Tax=Dankookia sp. P2 TaxID=3423955 RepID=UPI003D6741BC
MQTGQVQMGEILLGAYGNEDPIFEVDFVPFLAATYPQGPRAARSDGAGAARQVREAGDHSAVLRALAGPGALRQDGDPQPG